MIRRSLATLALAALAFAGCRAPESASAIRAAALDPDHPARSEEPLFEILRHAFLWHYDQSFRMPGDVPETLDVRFRSITRELDPGDNSRFAEIWLPENQLLIELKRSDYRIEELNLDVRDANFKIRRVVRMGDPPGPLASYERHLVSRDRLREWFTLRTHSADAPTPELRARLRETLLRNHFVREFDTSIPHQFHFAPVSKASDDLWVFHENMHQLLVFSSDTDLANESAWTTIPLRLTVYNLRDQPLIHDSVADAASATLSKEFIGRALYNCVVLGHRLEIQPDVLQEFLEEKARRESSPRR